MNAPTQTNHAPIRVPNPPSPDRTGQGTAIEQSRAAAEVYAAVLAAKNSPRDSQQAIRWMEDSCRIKALADKAFFRFPRAGSTVTGPSVHLARELARCWGNIQYGINELRRDDQHGQSEMQAFAWDLETNTRESLIFIVPHLRDKRGGPELLTDVRDIYESNANAGARRVREAIFAVLPLWFVEQAKELCTKTIQNGGGEPLEQRVSKAVKFFAEQYQISEGRLTAKVGRPPSQWTALDLAPLEVIAGSLRRGEVTVEDEFPAEQAATASAAEVASSTAPEGAEPRARGRRPAAKAAPKADESTDTAPASVPDPSELDPDNLPAEGGRPWHEQGHPRAVLDGTVETADRRLDGSCGFCEQEDDQ